jgi:hypothetical protein
MLTGRRAFRRDSPAETMTAILNEHPPEPGTLRPDVSPSVDRIVQHCLEKHVAERFQSARDVAFALDAFSGSSSAAHAAAPQPARALRERAAWIALTVALGAAAVVPWLINPRGTTPARWSLAARAAAR